MKRLRGAIVGFGRVALEAHLPGFRNAERSFEIVAIADPSAERRAAANEAVSGIPTFADFASLAAAVPKLDFVDVATPPRQHAALALEALGKHVHVLCEKPLAIEAVELSNLERGVRRSGKTLFTVHNWKHAPIFRRLRGLLSSGIIGEPAEIEWRVLRPNPPEGAITPDRAWRLDPGVAGGGVLMDHGWHAFYLMPFLAAQPARSVSARIARDRDLAVEDRAEVVLDFGGCIARIELSWVANERRTGGIVRGPRGEISIEDDALRVRAAGRPESVTRFSPALSASSYHPEWFPALLEDFRGEVLDPARRGRNFAEAVLCFKLVTAAYRSSGDLVPLAPVDANP